MFCLVITAPVSPAKPTTDPDSGIFTAAMAKPGYLASFKRCKHWHGSRAVAGDLKRVR
ncbi:hypothetical protein SAMN05216330_11966 [Bradyrhizobium sp. Ghvi]|nr:hypothetical protein SAMN05216330_11966 [Bradyrhizobium sp. Ghvi]